MTYSKPETHIDGLLQRMTLGEKVGQLVMIGEEARAADGAPFDLAAAIRTGALGSVLNVTDPARIASLCRTARHESRLGIPLLVTLDIVHGHRTTFPVPLAEACAFNPDLWRRTARCAAKEARHDGIALTFAPMLDVCLDPRWGRIVEGPGEDPWIAEEFARAKVAGFQGDAVQGRIGAQSIAATAKHFVAYGAVTAGREYAGADVSARMLRDVYLPPFKAAVEAGVAAIMPGFIALGGVPLTADYQLLTTVLREEWGFEGVIISDYAAVAELIAHGVAADLVEAAALALRAGVDIDMMGHAYAAGLPQALERGLIGMAQIDAAVRRVLRLKERLGLFDEDRDAPPRLESTEPDIDCTLALEAAAQSVVLLKNAQNVLPLAPAGGPIAVIGPLVQAQEDMLGPWSALGEAAQVSDFLTAMRRNFAGRSIIHAQGCSVAHGNARDLAEALKAAKRAEHIVLCLGESREMSGEGGSRAAPVLPEAQALLAREILALGIPTVIILFSGRPLIATHELAQAHAALAAWFPGHKAGRALAEILAGSRAPGGRLAVSWPAEIGQIPLTYREMPSGRPVDPANRLTSRYLDASNLPLYPFGHGLTYATFVIETARLEKPELRAAEDAHLFVEVRNSSTRAGEAVVFIFLHDHVATIARPLLELRAVRKVRIEAGETVELDIGIPAADFAVPGPEGPRHEPGRFSVCVSFNADRDRLIRLDLDLQ